MCQVLSLARSFNSDCLIFFVPEVITFKKHTLFNVIKELYQRHCLQ